MVKSKERLSVSCWKMVVKFDYVGGVQSLITAGQWLDSKIRVRVRVRVEVDIGDLIKDFSARIRVKGQGRTLS
jgi:hypothetical protein